MSMGSDPHTLRVFVATWNVGGKIPHSGLDLNEFLQLKDQSVIYVLGFQEIVPLNAGNVLVIEDNDPAVKWLSLINQALNKGPWLKKFDFPNTSTENEATCSSNASITKPLAYKDPKPTSGLLFFQKPSLKSARRSFRIVRGRQLKSCNCPCDLNRKYSRDSCFNCQETDEDNLSSEEDGSPNNYMDSDISPASITNQLKYSLIAWKQMVGIFLTVWVRKELVPHIGHLKLSCIGRGILGYLGNKGCISVRFSLHQATFCFVCSHLASGEKEGDELKRNYDVIEILKNTQFSRNCKVPGHRIPEKILEHDRVIWLGDVNYRIALTYSETQKLLKKKKWDALLDKDQLKIEREAGRAFKGWEEGKIEFSPTYKYSDNSDSYAGDSLKTRKKRRTPAWCDRILWHGNGIKQHFYVRGELRFSDHRPVCAVFVVEISTNDGKMKNGPPMNVEVQHISPPMGRYLELCGL